MKGFKVEDEFLQTKVSKLIGYMLIINGLLAIGSVFLKPIFSIMLILFLVIEVLTLQIWVYLKERKK